MFIQVIEGKTEDPDGLHHQLDVSERDLRPGATGYQGSTGGCTDGGDCILIVRFDSREAAQENSDRPEQGAWWEETEKCFSGPVVFHDSDDVTVMSHGDLDSAHFVQVMDGHVTDHDRAMELERRSEPLLAKARPDLLGAVTAFYDDDGFTGIAYFSSEGAARRGESRAPSADVKDLLEERESLMRVENYFDIRHPWLISA